MAGPRAAVLPTLGRDGFSEPSTTPSLRWIAEGVSAGFGGGAGTPAHHRLEPHPALQPGVRALLHSAGSWHLADTELSTAECHRVLDQVWEVNPNPVLILSAGSLFLRDDLEEIAARASAGGATVVVGTNGTRLTDGASSRSWRRG